MQLMIIAVSIITIVISVLTIEINKYNKQILLQNKLDALLDWCQFEYSMGNYIKSMKILKVADNTLKEI